MTASAVLGPIHWALDLLTHPRPHYVAGLIVVGVAAVAVRAWGAGMLAGLLAVPHLLVMADPTLTAPAVAEERTNGRPITIATINVQWGNQDPTAVLDLVARTQPDILILQEAIGQWSLHLPALRALYPHAAPQTWQDGARLIVLSQLPMLGTREEVNGPYRDPTTMVSLDTGTTPLTLIAAHTSPPIGAIRAASRNAQLWDLAQLASATRGPLIVAGDFNTTPWSPHYRATLGATDLVNVAGGLWWPSTWPDQLGPFGIPIDHILVSESIVPVELNIVGGFGSDHRAVIATLRLEDDVKAAGEERRQVRGAWSAEGQPIDR